MALASRDKEAVPLMKEQPLSGSGCCDCVSSSERVELIFREPAAEISPSIGALGESDSAAAMSPSISDEEHFRTRPGIFPGRLRPSPGVLGEFVFVRGLMDCSPEEAEEERAPMEWTTSSIIAVSAAFLRNGM
jgi:hypothetical protein